MNHTEIQHLESLKISKNAPTSTPTSTPIPSTQLDKNKAAATALLLRMSIKLEMSSQVDVTTIVTRTEQL